MSEGNLKLPIPRSWFTNLALKIVGTLAVISVTSICTAVGTAYHFMNETQTRLAVLETEMKGLISHTNQRVDVVNRQVETAINKSKVHESQIVGLQREDRQIHEAMRTQNQGQNAEKLGDK
jgi:hypothetical protein